MKLTRSLSFFIGLIGLSIVIIIHELGHLIAAKLSNVPVALFSIGFGPKLVSLSIGPTIYQIAVLPLGGFVEISQQSLDIQPYPIQAFILLAGIFANILLAFTILFIFHLKNVNIKQMIHQATQQYNQTVMGPIGIISLISYSALLGPSYFFLILASLSISIAVFNLLPIPFFDGGQLAWYTMETFTGPLHNQPFNTLSNIFMAIFLILFIYITIQDIRFLRR